MRKHETGKTMRSGNKGRPISADFAMTASADSALAAVVAEC